MLFCNQLFRQLRFALHATASAAEDLTIVTLWRIHRAHAWEVPYALIAPCFLAAIAVYYVDWKCFVGFLNRVLGIA